MGKKNRRTRPRRANVRTLFFLVLFPLLFVGAGLAALVAGGGRALDGFQSSSWPRVEGTIVHVSRRYRQGSDIVTAVYDYYVGDVHHRSNQYSFSFSSAPDGRYRVGDRVQVFYSAATPSKAVLKPGAGTSVLLPIFGGVFVLIGLYIARAIYREGV